MRYVQQGTNVHDFIFEGQEDFCLEKVVGDQESLQLMCETGSSVFIETIDLAEALQQILALEGNQKALMTMSDVIREMKDFS